MTTTIIIMIRMKETTKIDPNKQKTTSLASSFMLEPYLNSLSNKSQSNHHIHP